LDGNDRLAATHVLAGRPIEQFSPAETALHILSRLGQEIEKTAALHGADESYPLNDYFRPALLDLI
jgi:hypothetical protein